MRNKKYNTITLIILFANILFSSKVDVHKQYETIFNEANDLYSKNNFIEARSGYIKVLDEISIEQKCSAEVFYNIGNCYFRENKLGYARYYYELAQLVNPRDKDISYNLDYVKKISNNEESEDIFFKIHKYFSLNELHNILFFFNLSFFIFLVGSFIIKFRYVNITRNIFFIFFVVTAILFYIKLNNYLKVYGIIVEPCNISSAPEENFLRDSVMVNEGKKVIVLSEKENFYAVYLPVDNLKGWIKKDYVKLIKI